MTRVRTGRSPIPVIRTALVLAGLILVALPAAPPVRASFPGTNGRIYYYREMTPLVSDTSEIFSIKPDGSGNTRLTNNGIFDGDPAASPDGKFLFFTRKVNGDTEVFRMRSDGSNPRNLTKTEDDSWEDFFPAPSPNGKMFVFASTRAGGDAIFKQPVEGGEAVQLSNPNPGSYDGNPEWSANGKWIVFDRFSQGENASFICFMEPDGSAEECRTDSSELDAGRPHWSPSSKRILFAANEADDPDDDLNIFAAKPDITNLVRLTSGTARLDAPVYSPDGTKIVFQRGEHPGRLMVMNADGFGGHPLTPAGKDAQSPDWSVKP